MAGGDKKDKKDRSRDKSEPRSGGSSPEKSKKDEKAKKAEPKPVKKKSKARRLQQGQKTEVKMRVFQQCGLKHIKDMDQFNALYAAFQVLAVENDTDDSNLFLERKDAALWLRAMGWCWTDTELEAALRRGGSHTAMQRYSVVELMRCADNHLGERFGAGPATTTDEIEKRKADQKEGVKDVFKVFTNTNQIMRGDLLKYLMAGYKASQEEFTESFPTTKAEQTSHNRPKSKEDEVEKKIEPGHLNSMLEQLGYESTLLTFPVDTLAERIAAQLWDIPDENQLK